jgi:hypothetical protein
MIASTRAWQMHNFEKASYLNNSIKIEVSEQRE